ncbi:dehydrogenase [Falsiroseomonas bella]|uniref:Dehydrogenase n=1 Tax=Falsiroseomonas bella TaxID=2184016 RepID=A0A317FNN8_9PROT|nr:SDR family NAD(P)-dependent oxidoreductase [Falsiroseomonas bella]PWS39088.1 dehydrogenase [Falsiroseomonas bella]
MSRFRAVAISGASRGLGAALAARFAAPGVRLLLIARSAAALEAVAAVCTARGATVRVAALDIADAPAVAAALARFEAEGALDLVIANAGTSAGTLPDGEAEPLEAARRQVAVNLLGAMNLVGPVLPGMLARGAGGVTLVASLAAFRGLPDSPGYCASKAGLLAWGEALRGACAPRGVRVTVVCPGYFDSAMGDRYLGSRPLRLSLEAAAERTVRAIEAGRALAAFPWPLACLLRLLALLPAPLGDAALRRMRFRIRPEASP